MRPRMNQLAVNILLLIVITGIVVYACVNLAEMISMVSDAVGSAITKFNLGM